MWLGQWVQEGQHCSHYVEDIVEGDGGGTTTPDTTSQLTKSK